MLGGGGGGGGGRGRGRGYVLHASMGYSGQLQPLPMRAHGAETNLQASTMSL